MHQKRQRDAAVRKTSVLPVLPVKYSKSYAWGNTGLWPRRGKRKEGLTHLPSPKQSYTHIHTHTLPYIAICSFPYLICVCLFVCAIYVALRTLAYLTCPYTHTHTHTRTYPHTNRLVNMPKRTCNSIYMHGKYTHTHTVVAPTKIL